MHSLQLAMGLWASASAVEETHEQRISHRTSQDTIQIMIRTSTSPPFVLVCAPDGSGCANPPVTYPSAINCNRTLYSQNSIFISCVPPVLQLLQLMGCTGSDGLHGMGGELEPELDYQLHGHALRKTPDQKPESNLIQTSEVTEEQFMASKPWIGALKSPTEVPPIDSSPPTTNLTLVFVNGYKAEDARSVVYFGASSSTIIYPAAAVGIVMDTKSLKQRFMGAGNAKTANGHVDDITCLAVSPDKKLAATGSLGKQPLLLVWDVNSLEVKARTKLARNTNSISCVRFSPDGQYVFCTDKSTDANVYCYRANDLSLVTQQKCSEVILDIDVSADNTVGVATAQGVWLFKLEEGSFKRNRGIFGDSKRQGMVSIVYNTQHKTFISGSMLDGSFYIWEKGNCARVRKMHDGSVMCMKAVEDNIYSSGGKDNVLKISNYDGDVIKTIILPSYAKSIDVSKDKIVVGTKDGCIIEIDGDKKTELIKGHYTGETWGLAVGNGIVYTSGDDNRILAFNTKTQKVEQEAVVNEVAGQKFKIGGASTLALTPPNQQARALALNKKGHLAVGINDGTLSVRTASNIKNEIFRSNDPKEWIEVMKYSPQEDMLAVGSHDKKIYIYSVEGDKYSLRGTLNGHSSFITGIDWSVDGKTIKSVCGAYELLFWDVQKLSQVPEGATLFRDTKWANSSGKIGWDVQGIFPPAADGTHVNGVERSADGKLIVTGDDWGFINIYRCPCLKGSQCVSFRGHSSHITGVRFNESNDSLYSVGGSDKTLMVWKVS